jgi:C-terminal processing protease CtpA/Prc
MSPTAKSLTAAAAILVATGSILGGAVMRDRVDVGGANAPGGLSVAGLEPLPPTGLVASRNASEVPEGDYFYEISNLLKQRYVEKITDEQKLALGAIRGMVTSLGDPDSLYLDKDMFAAHRKMRMGQYEGIGAQLEVVYGRAKPQEKTPTKQNPAQVSGATPVPEEAVLGSRQLPRLTVVSIVPGGPADKAGVKVGDYVEYVDSHWVPNAETVASFRKLQKDFDKGAVTWQQLSKVRLELTQRMKKMITPVKAREKLLVGDKGTTQVVWKRGTESISTTIVKAPSRLPVFSEVDGVIQLRFAQGVEVELKDAIQGKSELVIDLRNNANGLPQPMQACLELLAPKGAYGVLKIAKREVPFQVKVGNANPPKITLLVDESTRGVSEVFADALVQAGVAKTSGKPTSGHRIFVQDYPLPDGSGYTLAVATYVGGAK